jgi:Vitamin K-dependent gamma-carboxylase
MNQLKSFLNLETLKQKSEVFFTAQINPAPLGIFRILIASFTILQAILWYNDWLAFFNEDGWIQWEISKAIVPSLNLHIADIHLFLSKFGFSTEQTVMTFYWIYLISAFGLLFGYYTYVWGVIVWFCHYVLMCSIDVFTYGVDIFLQISLFYLIFIPSNKFLSLDLKLGRTTNEPTWASTLAIRVLQIHMCLAYFSAGYEKMLAADWWNGNVMWRSVVQPDFRQYNLEILASVPFIPMILSWFTMILETFYFIAMWIKGVRFFWLFGIIVFHLGIGIFLGLWLFGLIMILLSCSVFGFDAYLDFLKMKKSAQVFVEKK